MRVDRFDYTLPIELIAQTPAPQREQARLLVPSVGASPTSQSLALADGSKYPSRSLAAAAEPTGHFVADLPSLIAPRSVVVLNDTRVLAARILGSKEGTGGKAEVFLVRRLGNDAGESAATFERWSVLGRASKALRRGTRILKDSLVIEFEGEAKGGLFEVRLSTRDGSPVDEARRKAGQVPLPPYIRRHLDAEDASRYQTVFARTEGAVAAPTAGLHLTRALISQLESRGCEVVTCTLHVGLGTFQPVTVSDLDDHPMHSESFVVSQTVADAIARARERGSPVVAVGTTVVRALESAQDPSRAGHVLPSSGETRILIQPGYQFSIVDRLVTNFHLPKSTLLALVCAFAGTEQVLAAYAAAVKERYRFFSYGDAMLLDRLRGTV